jgi:hypothetical protein
MFRRGVIRARGQKGVQQPLKEQLQEGSYGGHGRAAGGNGRTLKIDYEGIAKIGLLASYGKWRSVSGSCPRDLRARPTAPPIPRFSAWSRARAARASATQRSPGHGTTSSSRHPGCPCRSPPKPIPFCSAPPTGRCSKCSVFGARKRANGASAPHSSQRAMESPSLPRNWERTRQCGAACCV